MKIQFSTLYLKIKNWRKHAGLNSPYVTVLFWVSFVTLINRFVFSYLGYRAIGFLFLFLVIILGLFFSFGPILIAAALSALIWNYDFIPPEGSFAIHAPEDVMMFVTYFVVALVSGFFSLQIRKGLLLKESHKLHQTLLQSVSHELRTPLTTIMGAATTLESQKPLSDQQKDLVHEIILASERLNHVFENLLDMTRLEAGNTSLNKEWFEAGELVRYFLEKQKKTISTHKVETMIPPKPIYIHGDFGLLEHALAHIVLNAVYYSPQHSSIIIKIEKGIGEILIHVQDHGRGIPNDQLPFIFDKFYRIPGSPTGGLGLGLSIAKNLVELHQGHIEVRNNQSYGTTFTIVLPDKKFTMKENGK
jgi:two-component system sensor histidine kinase KdpD